MRYPRLQEGIYYDHGETPGDIFGIVFLRATPEATAATVGAALLDLWQHMQACKAGQLPDLPGTTFDYGPITMLLGLGMKCFRLPGALRTDIPLAQMAGQTRSPNAMGGGPVFLGAGLHYAPDIQKNEATEEIALQFIGQSALAVNLMLVELWKFLSRLPQPAPLQLAAFYKGFSRPDRRSWLGFHDGISNLRSGAERQGVVQIKDENAAAPADHWTRGGSYLAFMRIVVDIEAWERLSHTDQEILVGRTKLSGCPISHITTGPVPQPVANCPATGTSDILAPENAAFRSPPRSTDTTILASHVQRANQSSQVPNDENSLRIYRQGYEFFEAAATSPGFHAGLNFVSFQDTPLRLKRILTQQGWLGQVNFGGLLSAQPPGMTSLLTVRAAGIYLVPPVTAGEVFPGSSVFLP